MIYQAYRLWYITCISCDISYIFGCGILCICCCISCEPSAIYYIHWLSFIYSLLYSIPPRITKMHLIKKHSKFQCINFIETEKRNMTRGNRLPGQIIISVRIVSFSLAKFVLFRSRYTNFAHTPPPRLYFLPSLSSACTSPSY